jgi:transketolase
MDKDKSLVWVLTGDGELQEGQIWEAVMSAAHYKLGKLICVVDWNAAKLMVILTR